jgi:hypothetical protein
VSAKVEDPRPAAVRSLETLLSLLQVRGKYIPLLPHGGRKEKTPQLCNTLSQKILCALSLYLQSFFFFFGHTGV